MARRVFQMRDKHLSTTNLYPKQIEQSLPEGVVPVEPEPETYEPTGEEPVAQYITIDGTVYKVGGTDVIANPTLAGTEVYLTGLQVGDTKYKVPSGSFTQEQADWTEADNTKPSYIKNKPALKTVATSGSYNDLTDKPTLFTTKQLLSTIPTTYSTFGSSGDYHLLLETPENINNDIEVTMDIKLSSLPAFETVIFKVCHKQDTNNNVTINTSTFYMFMFQDSLLSIQATYTSSGLQLYLSVVLTQGAGTPPVATDFRHRIRSVKELINY